VHLPAGAQRVLIACSGGGDSAALAALTAAAAPALGLEIALAHCDHGLREGSAAEAEFVQALGARLGLPVHALSLAIPAGGNLEAAARRARYAALGALAERLGAAALLTGHSADDQAETLWLWLLRGTGPAGLAPLPASRPIRPGAALLVLRPLLGFGREALRDYLRARAIPWLEDPSNADLSLRRNRVRQRLLPGLAAEYGIDPTANALRLGEQMAELLAFLDAELAARGLGEAARRGFTWDRRQLAALPPALARRFLVEALRPRDLTAGPGLDRLLRELRMDQDRGALSLDASWELRFDAEQLTLARPGELPPDAPSRPQLPAAAAGRPLPTDPQARLSLADGWALVLTRRDGNPGPPASARGAVFDAELLAEPLRLERPQAGQRIRPLGLGGSRRLADVFVDLKVPRPLRAGWPLLVDAEGRLIWVPGLLRSDQAPLGPQTRRCLCLDLEPPCA
jgi:tRNA(Ile)-lysidine synthase